MLVQALCIISSVNSNWSYSPEMPNFGQNWWFFVLCDLEIWKMTLENNRAPLLCHFKLCASFCSHWWIQTRVTVWKPNLGQNGQFFAVWPWNLQKTLKNNRAPLLSTIKLWASFYHHIWIQTGVMVRKLQSWVLTSVTLTFDLDLLLGHHSCHWQ